MDTDKWQHGSCKKKKRTTFLCVSYSRIIPQHGLTLSRVGFGLLQLFQGWTTLKAPKLLPTVVHVGLIGHPILTHYMFIRKGFDSSENTSLYLWGGFYLTKMHVGVCGKTTDSYSQPKQEMAPQILKYNKIKRHCHNGFFARLGRLKTNQWSRHQSFLYRCDWTPKRFIFL